MKNGNKQDQYTCSWIKAMPSDFININILGTVYRIQKTEFWKSSGTIW